MSEPEPQSPSPSQPPAPPRPSPKPPARGRWWVGVGVVIVLAAGAAWLVFGNRWQARHDVRELQRGLAFYLAEQGAYPQGSTAEICALLLGQSVAGQNPSRKSYIEARPHEMNGAGEFIDPWGTPYRVIVAGTPRVYSCGRNRQDEQGGGDDITP